MLRSYLIDTVTEKDIEDAFIEHTSWDLKKGRPYVIKGSEKLTAKIFSNKMYKGFTGTAGGFYGPQGRVLRLKIQDNDLNSKMDSFNFKGTRMTNLEMETAAIYGLGKLLGHECLSLNAIIANRISGDFSNNPSEVVENLIEYTLDKMTK
jgi:uridine phosphorylase